MGLRYRKSINLGPVRINLSKSGVGYSVGTKGYRVTKKADGGIRKTVSIPGTGISHVTEYSKTTVQAAKKQPKPTTKQTKDSVTAKDAIIMILVTTALLFGAFWLGFYLLNG